MGPRQCGKTTLAQSLGGRYFDLEDEADLLKLDLSWDGLMEQRDLVVLDEAQVHPPVFKRMRSAIDRHRQDAGRFLMLGSVSPALMREVSQSLAGRLGLVELTPLFLDEIGARHLDDLWLFGGYPDGGVLGTDSMPGWQRNYLALLAQCDLPAWGLPAKPQATDRLFSSRVLSASERDARLGSAPFRARIVKRRFCTTSFWRSALAADVQPIHSSRALSR